VGRQGHTGKVSSSSLKVPGGRRCHGEPR